MPINSRRLNPNWIMRIVSVLFEASEKNKTDITINLVVANVHHLGENVYIYIK